MRQITAFRIVLVCVLLPLLAACGTSRDEGYSPYAKPGEGKGYYKVGNPYKIKGQWYRPQEDYSYDETGIASWYGADFHARLTANGEVYNKNELTAAHKTLPLPSLARVTNLENGRSLVVRINDRGPFSGARIIDVSQRVAQLLGFERQGTAKVRVQVMAEESKAIADAMRSYGGASPTIPQPLPEPELAPRVAEAVPPVRTATLATFRPEPVVEQVPVIGENKIYIQAGAFTNPENAQRLQAKMTAVGPAVIAQADIKNVRYFRVRVGPINTVAEADRLLKKVVASGAPGARIIVD